MRAAIAVLIMTVLGPLAANAQVVSDGSGFGTGSSWRNMSSRFGFFNVSRRQVAAPYEDAWQSRDPGMTFGGEPWMEGGWSGGDAPWTDGCCESICDPCLSCCDAGGMPPSPVAPGTPRALPIPTPLDPANPSPEYVPRNKVPTPLETPDDPDWHKIPEPGPNPAPKPKPEPEAAAPVELPTEITIPGPIDKNARRAAPHRTSSRFIPVPRPTAARVMNLQPDVR